MFHSQEVFAVYIKLHALLWLFVPLSYTFRCAGNLRIKSRNIVPYTEDCPRQCANGFAAKFAVASVIARPLFCIPTSIARAVALSYSTWKMRPASNPSPIPARLCKITIQSTRNPDVMIFSAFTATIPLMIMTMDTTEISGRMPDNFSICLPISLRRRIPRRTGISTTLQPRSPSREKIPEPMHRQVDIPEAAS